MPTRLPRSADGKRVLDVVFADKKRRAGATHTMVLPRARMLPPADAPARAGTGVCVVEDVTTLEIEAALDARR